jgi:PAS domain S-box-containing protein
VQSPPPSLGNAYGSISRLSLRLGSWLLFAASGALLVVVISTPRLHFDSGLRMALLGTLVGAIALQLRYFLRERWYHREAASAFQTADREFRSVFEHALDAIVIVNGDGICLNANPATFALLGLPRAALIGHPIRDCYRDPQQFDRDWRAFLDAKYQRGQAELIRDDQTTLFVSYTAAANYLPGRHVLILCDTTQRKLAETSLRHSQLRFEQMADQIQEVFWMMDAQTKEVKYVNPAYETITGRTVASLYENPLSYLQLIHSEDRDRVLSKLEDAVSIGSFDEEFRIIRTNGELRWVSVKALLVRDSGQARCWLIGTSQDVTARKHAEIESGAHLAAAEAARAETNALRKSTLALSQNLAMDTVLDTLLACLLDLVPYSSASVLLVEEGTELLVARVAPKNSVKRSIVTLTLEEQPLLQPIVREHKSLSVADTQTESDWRNHRAFVGIRSWLGVPLMASGEVLGVLSVGSSDAHKFTAEHFRLAKSLAIPAAVAIRNARLYERAEIYAAELQCRLQQIDDSGDIAGTPEARKSSRS